MPPEFHAQDPGLLSLLGLQAPPTASTMVPKTVSTAPADRAHGGAGFLSTDPMCRLAARTALETHYLRGGTGPMDVLISNAAAHRGPVSVVGGRVPDFIRDLPQGETGPWAQMHEALASMPRGGGAKRRNHGKTSGTAASEVAIYYYYCLCFLDW